VVILSDPGLKYRMGGRRQEGHEVILRNLLSDGTETEGGRNEFGKRGVKGRGRSNIQTLTVLLLKKKTPEDGAGKRNKKLPGGRGRQKGALRIVSRYCGPRKTMSNTRRLWGEGRRFRDLGRLRKKRNAPLHPSRQGNS